MGWFSKLTGINTPNVVKQIGNLAESAVTTPLKLPERTWHSAQNFAQNPRGELSRLWSRAGREVNNVGREIDTLSRNTVDSNPIGRFAREKVNNEYKRSPVFRGAVQAAASIINPALGMAVATAEANRQRIAAGSNSWKNVGKAGATAYLAGQVGSGVGEWAQGASSGLGQGASQFIGNAAGGTASNATGQYINTGSVDVGNALQAGIGGAAIGAVTKPVSNYVGNTTNSQFLGKLAGNMVGNELRTELMPRPQQRPRPQQQQLNMMQQFQRLPPEMQRQILMRLLQQRAAQQQQGA